MLQYALQAYKHLSMVYSATLAHFKICCYIHNFIKVTIPQCVFFLFCVYSVSILQYHPSYYIIIAVDYKNIKQVLALLIISHNTCLLMLMCLLQLNISIFTITQRSIIIMCFLIFTHFVLSWHICECMTVTLTCRDLF